MQPKVIFITPAQLQKIGAYSLFLANDTLCNKVSEVTAARTDKVEQLIRKEAFELLKKLTSIPTGEKMSQDTATRPAQPGTAIPPGKSIARKSYAGSDRPFFIESG
jgi:hypothetical protein